MDIKNQMLVKEMLEICGVTEQLPKKLYIESYEVVLTLKPEVAKNWAFPRRCKGDCRSW